MVNVNRAGLLCMDYNFDLQLIFRKQSYNVQDNKNFKSWRTLKNCKFYWENLHPSRGGKNSKDENNKCCSFREFDEETDFVFSKNGYVSK